MIFVFAPDSHWGGLFLLRFWFGPGFVPWDSRLSFHLTPACYLFSGHVLFSRVLHEGFLLRARAGGGVPGTPGDCPRAAQYAAFLSASFSSERVLARWPGRPFHLAPIGEASSG